LVLHMCLRCYFWSVSLLQIYFMVILIRG